MARLKKRSKGKSPMKKVAASRKSFNKDGTKKKPKINDSNFKLYIHKVLKQVRKKNELLTISKKAMIIVNDFMIDVFQRIAGEASKLARMDKSRNGNKNSILSSHHIQTAVHFHLPGELWKHAKSEGTKAVQKYWDSKK